MTDHAPTVPTDVAALPGGGSMPLLGFGTWQLKGSLATDATRWALEAGYRHVDTAHVYGNEAAVGAALASAAVDRDDIRARSRAGGRIGGGPARGIRRATTT